MKVAALALALFPAVALLSAWLVQRRLIYPAPPRREIVAADGFGVVALQTADGLVLRGLYRPARPGRRTIVFFHGNGDSLAGATAATKVIADAGYGVLLPEYRGYGGNDGSPSEAGLYADARAATAFLRGQGIASRMVVAIGNSLGSGPATDVATSERLAGLIIVSGFTSLPEAAADAVRLPVRALVRDRFDNAAKLRRASVPTLVLHGDVDRVIAFGHGQRLAAAARAPLVRFAGAGHGLAYWPEAGAAEVRWLDALLAD